MLLTSTYTYAYNGDGLRTSKTVSSTTESYTWNPAGNLLVDGSTNFLYGPSGVVEQEDSTSTGNPLYFAQDSMGSTRALLNQSGTVAGTYTYDTYGAVASHTGSSSRPIGYTGSFTDAETGFLYLVHRYYDPATGQFLSVDPLVARTGQPYGYAAGDPVNGSDPSGLISGWGRFMSHVPMAGTWAVGWDSMSGKEQLADITLPITLPLTGLAVVSGVGDLAGASVFGLGATGSTAVAVGSGAVSAAWDSGQCFGLDERPACIGAALSLGGVGGGVLGGAWGAESILGGLAGALGFAVAVTGVVWDLLQTFVGFENASAICPQK